MPDRRLLDAERTVTWGRESPPRRSAGRRPPARPSRPEPTMRLEEALQYRREDRRIDVVPLTVQETHLPLGKGLCERRRRVTHPRHVAAAGDHQRRDLHAGCPIDWDPVIAHDPRVVRERVRERLRRGPEWLLLRALDELGGQADDLRHEVLDGIAAPSF